MKKVLILLVLMLSLFVSGCFSPIDPNQDDDIGNKEDGRKKDETGNKDDNKDEEDKLVLEENTPQWWIDLFTFDNVTILLKNNITIKLGDEYKCVDGKWYCKYQGRDGFEDHNGRYIFDIYLSNYSIFTYDEESNSYKASGIALDESGYLREIIISMNDGKIDNISDVATLNSSTIISALYFYDYGVTSLITQEEQKKDIISKVNCVGDEVGIYMTSITLGDDISDKGTIEMKFYGEKRTPQEDTIVVTLRLEYEKDSNGNYQYKTFYNDDVYQNKTNLTKIKFDLTFDSRTRPSKLAIFYTPENGSCEQVYPEE